MSSNSEKAIYTFNKDETLRANFYSDSLGEMFTACEYKIVNDTMFVQSLDYGEQISKQAFEYTDTFYVAEDSCIIQKWSGDKFCK